MAELHVEFPPKLDFLFRPRRYKICKGGRGSGKSWGIARALILQTLQSKRRVLCAREFQRSIRDSVHRLLSDQIEAMGLSSQFEILQNEIRCLKTGSAFLFTGLATATVDSIKSFEGVDVCWVEEAQTVSERSWEILIPTIRADGSEIWVSFNPDSIDDPTFKRFVTNTPPNTTVQTLNFSDNPWFPKELKAEKDYLYQVDPEAAAHVWGGECRKVSDAQVLRGRYRVQSFEPRPDLWDGPYQGVDFGFATDPSVMVRCWIWEGELYVEHEAYGMQVESDLLPSLFDSIPGARNYVSRADSARPETISLLQRMGYKRMMACKKWPGSIEDNTEHLRSYQGIVIHPRCVNTAIEARLWGYKTDKLTGDVKPELKDGNDHCINAIWYALNPIVMGWREGKRNVIEEEEDDGLPNYPQTGSWLS